MKYDRNQFTPWLILTLWQMHPQTVQRAYAYAARFTS